MQLLTLHELPGYVARWRPEIDERLRRIELALRELMSATAERVALGDCSVLTVSEFAKLTDREPATIREYCRKGRLRCTSTNNGPGGHPCYRLTRDELDRYKREGLLTVANAATKP